MVLDGFAQADLRPSTLVSALRDEKKDHLSGLGKAASTIKDYVNASLHPILEGKTPPEMWTILEGRFHHISPMSIVAALTDGCIRKLSEYKNVVDYTNSYQLTLDKVASLTKAGSHMHLETAEMMLQANMLRNLGSEYSALVSAIQTEWKEENTNLSDTILRVIRYEKFIKETTVGGDKSQDTKALATGIHRAPKGTCTTPECVERGLTTHYNDRCWVKNPELRAKYALRQMRPRGSNRNLRKTNAQAAEQPGPTTAPQVELES